LDKESIGTIAGDESSHIVALCDLDALDALDTLDDQTLAQRARHERDAFGALYQRHVTAIYRYVYYRVGVSVDAEDLTAKVFTRALRHIHNYSDRGLPFTAWLYRIAHNVVANFHRDNSRHPAIPFEEIDAHPGEHSDADHDIDAERDRIRLMRAIRKLPEERQHLIVLKFVEQKQNAEIGEIMNRSEGAVKSLYHRTLQQLREVLDDEERNATAMSPENTTNAARRMISQP
jgi:RNA polymerase sigma-70 factor (ECF subfamily)